LYADGASQVTSRDDTSNGRPCEISVYYYFIKDYEGKEQLFKGDIGINLACQRRPVIGIKANRAGSALFASAFFYLTIRMKEGKPVLSMKANVSLTNHTTLRQAPKQQLSLIRIVGFLFYWQINLSRSTL
jgi:hypothetical protein